MNAIAKKLLIKPGTNWRFINAPQDYLASLEPLPEGVTIATTGESYGVQLFAKNSAELATELKAIQKVLKPDTILWITYPKKNTAIPTDLEMMGNWDVAAKYNLRPVSSIAVNDTWTALRFKPMDQVKTSASRKSEIPNNEFADYLDVHNKVVTLPPDVSEAMQTAPEALALFNSLAWSHKKEYVVWVLSAKQEKTRVARVEKMVEMLSNGKKNPSDK